MALVFGGKYLVQQEIGYGGCGAFMGITVTSSPEVCQLILFAHRYRLSWRTQRRWKGGGDQGRTCFDRYPCCFTSPPRGPTLPEAHGRRRCPLGTVVGKSCLLDTTVSILTFTTQGKTRRLQCAHHRSARHGPRAPLQNLQSSLFTQDRPSAC